MGITNFLHPLKKRHASICGELEALDTRIGKIEMSYAELPELRRRAKELRDQVAHLSAVIRFNDSTWEEATVKPVKPFTHQLPVKLGSCSRTALAVLREAAEPMTTREVALAVLERNGIYEPDVGTLTRTVNAVNSSFRQRRGTLLKVTDEWPGRWSIDR